MKRIGLLISFWLLAMSGAYAQNQFGVKFAPGLMYNRVHTNPDTTSFSSDGVGFGFQAGPLFDYHIQDNYYLNTGLFLLINRFHVKNERIDVDEKHELQYLQCPLLLKFYTGEVALDTKIYLEVGPIGSIKINERISQLTSNKPFISQIKVWQMGGLFGVGVEYNISLFTSLFAGITYQLGFSSIVKQQRDNISVPPVFGYNDLILINLGIKF